MSSLQNSNSTHNTLMNGNLNRSVAQNLLKETHTKLKHGYLPELRALFSDCNWLRTNLAIDGSKTLQPNEVKLLQFVSLLEAVIAELANLQEDPKSHNLHDLQGLEARIVKTILPVKARLHERWNQQRRSEDIQSAQPSMQVHQIPQYQRNVDGGTSTPNNDDGSVQSSSLDSRDSMQQYHLPNRPQHKQQHKPNATSFVSDSSSSPTSVSNYSRNLSTITSSDMSSSSATTSSSTLEHSQQIAPTVPHMVGLEPLPLPHVLQQSFQKQQQQQQQQELMKIQEPEVTSHLHPRGVLDLNSAPEDFHPLAVREARYGEEVTEDEAEKAAFFALASLDDGDSDIEVNEHIFDNVPDCSIDLYDEDNATMSSERTLGKRGFSSMDHTLQQLNGAHISSGMSSSGSVLGTKKPPGPYYSSAVDIDLKASLLVTGSSGLVREEEYMSSRRRRRLNQIVPNPRKPRSADYTCSHCGEGYNMTVDANPWWAVYKHDCPHCKTVMIPRIDISQTSNAIELDPNVIALYGEGIDDSGDDADDFEYDDEDDDNSNDNGSGEHMLVEDKEAAEEEKVFDGDGLLDSAQASKLLVLMCHARTCAGHHASAKHAEICKSTKFLMLHIRDCKGTDMRGRDCLFSWCAPCKKMLRHLTTCKEASACGVCNPWCLPASFNSLRKMTQCCQQVQSATAGSG